MKPGTIEERLAALRNAFDAAFAAPIDAGRAATVDLLAIRFGERAFAVPVAELAGVHARRRIVPLPGSHPLCLGLAGVRGRLVGAYDLAGLLGAPPPQAAPWLLVSRRDPELGLAAPEAERYVRVELSAIVQRETEDDDACVGAVVHEGVARTVVSVDRLVAEITRTTAPRSR